LIKSHFNYENRFSAAAAAAAAAAAQRRQFYELIDLTKYQVLRHVP